MDEERERRGGKGEEGRRGRGGRGGKGGEGGEEKEGYNHVQDSLIHTVSVYLKLAACFFQLP